jgi:hypothetical protein
MKLLENSIFQVTFAVSHGNIGELNISGYWAAIRLTKNSTKII